MSFSASISELIERSTSDLVKKASHWERIDLGDVCEIINGFPFKSRDFSDNGDVKVIRIRDVTSGTSSTFYIGPPVDGYDVEDGDLLIGMDGDFNSRLWSDGPALLNQRVCKLVPNGKFLDKRFVAYALPGYLKLINDETHSVTVKHLSSNTLAALPFPLPPLAEQHRIVASIDNLFANTKRAREELGNIPHLIERYKRAILSTAFRGELTADWRAQNSELEPVENLVARTLQPEQTRGGREATETVIEGRAAISVNLPARLPPENWSWVSLRRIARQETGHTPSRKHPDYWDGDIPWIGIRDAANHHAGVIMDTSQHVTEQGLENSSARLLPTGTVCLSRTASVGYVVMMGRAMATSQDFVTWTCTDALDPKYLMYALLAEGDDIRRFGKGSTHTTIYFPEVRAFHICLAPIDEQKEIVRRIDDAFIWIDKIDQEHDAAIRLLDRLDQSILQKAFRGELVPQDPNDEPAIKLLQRIREERARLKKEKPPRKRQRGTGLETPMVQKKPSRRPVVEVISEQATSVSPERLFQLGGFAPEDVDAFYAEIKQAVSAGQIEQDSEKNLVLVR